MGKFMDNRDSRERDDDESVDYVKDTDVDVSSDQYKEPVEDSVPGDFDPTLDEKKNEVNQKIRGVLKESFSHEFSEDDLIHLAPADLKTGFYIDPTTIDKSGRFRYMFCMDMNGYDEVAMVQSIRNLMDSDLMTNSKDGAKREAQFLDFGSHVLRISRDQFEDIITDPVKCQSWAASLGRTVDMMTTGFKGAENENIDFRTESYPVTKPEVRKINPDNVLESDLSADLTEKEVIDGDNAMTEGKFTSSYGGN